jgi:hypothetical protein
LEENHESREDNFLECGRYLSLFLGHELSTVGHTNEARQQFERAAKLFPNAQSPLLALSRLALASGDSPGSLLAIQQVFALPAADPLSDPWWNYDVACVGNSAALVTETWKAFGAPRP